MVTPDRAHDSSQGVSHWPFSDARRCVWTATRAGHSCPCRLWCYTCDALSVSWTLPMAARAHEYCITRVSGSYVAVHVCSFERHTTHFRCQKLERGPLGGPDVGLVAEDSKRKSQDNKNKIIGCKKTTTNETKVKLKVTIKEIIRETISRPTSFSSVIKHNQPSMPESVLEDEASWSSRRRRLRYLRPIVYTHPSVWATVSIVYGIRMEEHTCEANLPHIHGNVGMK